MTCASFSFDSDFVLGENIPQDKAYFIEGDGGTDYIDYQQNPSGASFYDDVTIYCCDLSDFEEIFEDIYDTYGLASEYYSNSPNNLLSLVGTLEYPNGTLTENCQSQAEEVTWTINNKLVDTITINNKEVQSIKIGDKTIYQKVEEDYGDPNILFLDACDSSSNLTKYRSPQGIRYASISGSPSLAYDSVNDCYVFTNTTANDFLVYEIKKLDNKENFSLSLEFKFTSTSQNNNTIGLSVSPTTKTSNTTVGFLQPFSAASQVQYYVQNRKVSNSNTNVISATRINSFYSVRDWNKIHINIDSTTNKATWTFETQSGTKTTTKTVNIAPSVGDRHYGFFVFCNSSGSVLIRNIKAEKN